MTETKIVGFFPTNDREGHGQGQIQGRHWNHFKVYSPARRMVLLRVPHTLMQF